MRIGTLNDLNAEWTGGVFDATGERFFVSIQHNVTGGVIPQITGCSVVIATTWRGAITDALQSP